MSRVLFPLSLGLTLLVLSPLSAHAELLAYEGFDYDPTSRAVGFVAGEGSGFISRDTNPDPEQVDGAYEAESFYFGGVGFNNLVYEDLDTNGHHFWVSEIYGKEQGTVARFDVDDTGPLKDYLTPDGLVGAEGTTLYMSFLLQTSLVEPELCFLTFATVEGTLEQTFMGREFDVTEPVLTLGRGDFNSSVIAFGAGRQPSPNHMAVADGDAEVHLVVLKFEWVLDGADVATLYWDPEIDEGEFAQSNQAAGVKFTVEADRLAFNTLWLRESSTAPTTLRLDEFRFSSDWDSLFPQETYVAVSVEQPQTGGSIEVERAPGEPGLLPHGTALRTDVRVDEGYRFSKLIINGVEYEDPVQEIRVEEDISISAVIEPIPVYNVTLDVNPPEAAELVSIATDADVYTSRGFYAGTEITVRVRESDTFLLSQIRVDGRPVETWGDTVRFTITDDTALQVVFKDAPYVELSSSERTLPASGGSYVFRVEANYDWSIRSVEGWVLADDRMHHLERVYLGTASGWVEAVPSQDNPDAVTVVVEPNPFAAERWLCYAVTSEGRTASHVVRQEASDAEPFLEIDRAETSVAGTPWHRYSIEVTSNTVWEAATEAPWINVSMPKTIGDGTVHFSVDDNPPGGPRTGTIRIGDLEHLVVQDEVEGYLALEPGSSEIPSEGGSCSVLVRANIPWHASTSAKWVSLSPQSGSTGGFIQVTATRNPSVDGRTAVITVNGMPAAIRQRGRAGAWWEEIEPVSSYIDTAANGEVGIGWIHHRAFPWIYCYGLNQGEWLYIHASGADRSGFFAYSKEQECWLWASALWGWYYVCGDDGGWFPFDP